MEQEQEKYYVTRVNAYGKRPHTNYIVTLASGNIALTETPTLDALLVAIPTDEYIVKEDIIAVMDALAKTGGTEQTDEERLGFAKEMLLREIEAYDGKEKGEVNVFYLGELPMWYDKDKRMTIRNGVESSQTMGRDTYTLYDDETGLSVAVPCATALQMLAALEVYALDCLSTTNKHKAAVKALETVADVAGYDYTAGYPDKLTFNI